MKIRTISYARIAVVAVAIVGMAGFLIVSWHNDSRDKAIATVGSFAAAVAENMNHRVAYTETVLGLMARRPPVRALDRQSCDDGMQLILDSDVSHPSASIINSAGRIVCTIGIRGNADTADFSQSDWFRRAIAENAFVANRPFTSRVSGRIVTVFAYPSRDDRGRPIGVVSMAYEVAQVHPVFEDVVLPPGTSVTIVDPEGVVVSRQPETDWAGRNIGDHPIVRSALSGTVGTGIGLSAAGIEVVFGYKRLSKFPWTAVVSQPVDVVLAQTRRESRWAMRIAGCILLVVAFAAWLSTRKLTEQADQIAGTVRAIADGDFNARMVIPPLEELGTIARQFNRMLDMRDEFERRVIKLNQMYAALSETNHAITKTTDRQTMLERVCRTAAERCNLSLVWIGFIDAENWTIVPAAQFGPSAGYIHERGSITLRNPRGEGPLTRAIRENHSVVISDIATDSSAQPWRQRAEEIGVRSVGVFPLTEGGKVIGLINLYSPEVDYFNDPELLRLIEEIAGDLSFGLESFQREAIRQESEERFRQIAESIREVFWMTEPFKNAMLYISPAYREIWGRDTQELYASPRTWMDAIHADDRERVFVASITKQTAGTYDEEYRIVRPDGAVRWIHDRAFPIRDTAGDVYRVAGIAEDITERKEIEQALRRSEATLSAAQELAGLGSWERDARTGVARWSETMYQLLNRDPALGPPSVDETLALIDPADRPKLTTAQRRTVGTREKSFVEFRTDPARGPVRQVRSTLAPIIEGGEIVGHRGTLLDVTQIKDAEARLFQAQKMEALGNLAGGIAHDFNNMLLPIINLTEMSLDELPEDHPVRDHLGMVVEAAMRASQLVRQILAFGRRGDRKLDRIDIARAVGEALRLLRTTLPSTIKITDRIDPTTGFVEADAAELHSVMLNLGSNAAYAIDGRGGTLTISVSPDHFDASQADRNPKLLPHRNYAKIEIADSGHGMDAETIAKIFNPFFTTKPVGEGTGLGLAMVHGIVDNLEGSIDVTSTIGVGTKFTIYLPLSAADD
ncbi:MAG: multi-sensor hybrid histidine kinase [Rhodospirillales bacterium]|nr:multi-sensor hybrid histidine kinase [Rhodospirillales bacterium]